MYPLLILGLSTHTQPLIKKVADESNPIPKYTNNFKKYKENKKYTSEWRNWTKCQKQKQLKLILFLV